MFLLNFELAKASKVKYDRLNQNQIKVDGDYVGGLVKGRPVYTKGITKKTFIVNNKDELVGALKKSKKGDVVYIKDDCEIDLSSVSRITVPSGVTLASGRGKNGSLGAMIFTNTNGTRPLIAIGGPDVRITGLRIKGPDTEIYAKGNALTNKSKQDLAKNRLKYYKENMYGVPVSDGVISQYANLEIDNCEIFGWTHGGISLKHIGSKANIHHNYIHHNQRFGLGYGVVLDGAEATIKANLFDYNRHSVAGTGRNGTSYEVCYNIFNENNNGTWAVDMHGGVDRKDGTNIAGSVLLVHNNIFRLNEKALAVVVRGQPSEYAKIFDNQIYLIKKNNNNKESSRSRQDGAGLKARSLNGTSNMSSEDQFIQQRNAKGKFSMSNNQIKIAISD